MSKRIVESYKRKLASEEGHTVSRGGGLRIALCYPNTHAIGMANLGFHTTVSYTHLTLPTICSV